MATSLALLSGPNAEKLLHIKPSDIRADFIADRKRQLFFVDKFWNARPIDLEVGDLILAPKDVLCEGICLIHVERTEKGELFEASQPGHGRFTDPTTEWASFLRVSRRFYVGRSIYRHLEEAANE